MTTRFKITFISAALAFAAFAVTPAESGALAAAQRAGKSRALVRGAAVALVAGICTAGCASFNMALPGRTTLQAGTAHFDEQGRLTHVAPHIRLLNANGNGFSLHPFSVATGTGETVLVEVRAGTGAGLLPGENGVGLNARAAHIHPDGTVNIGYFEVVDRNGDGVKIHALTAMPAYVDGRLAGYTFTSKLNLGKAQAGQPVWAMQGDVKARVGTVSASGAVEFGVFENAFKSEGSISLIVGGDPSVGLKGTAIMTVKPVAEGRVDVGGFIPLSKHMAAPERGWSEQNP